MDLELENLNKSYQGEKVLDNINLKLSSGHSYILLGSNGAGKSTLMNILNGGIDYDTGNIFKVDSGRKETFSPIDVSMQDQFLEMLEYFTVEEAINYVKEISFPSRHNYQNLFELLEIEKSKKNKVRKLSGGQKKLLSIYISFLLNKRINIFDEPFADIDETKKNSLCVYINEYKKKNQKNILLTVSHEYSLNFDTIYTDAIYLKKGKIHFCGSVDKLLRSVNAKSLGEAFMKLELEVPTFD